MVSKILLLAVGAAVIGVVPAASAAQPPQPARIRADVVVMGFVPCSDGTSMRASSAPGFPNALVELRCRVDDAGAGTAAVAANATTDGRGRFRMAMNATAALTSTTTSSVGSACGLVVATPLATCDAALPAAGTLESGLRRLVGVVFFPRGFSYVAPSSLDRMIG